MTEPRQPETAVVEWDPGRWWAGRPVPPSWRRRLGPVLAGLGTLAMFGSLLGEWQTTRITAETGESLLSGDGREIQVGLAELGVWGVGWLVGAMVLTTAVALVVLGGGAPRPTVRTAGLAGAGVLLMVLVATTVYLRAGGPYRGDLFGLGGEHHEYSLGWGLVVAYGTVVLMAAALWSARVVLAGDPHPSTGPAGPVPGQADPAAEYAGPGTKYAGPADLTVTPTLPTVLLTDPDQRRRA
jgi:hypothetical protein